MSPDTKLGRRELLTTLASTTAAISVAGATAAASSAANTGAMAPYKQSVCRWCYGGYTLDALCTEAAAMGLASVELLDEPDWAVVKRHGLTCAMPNGPGGIAWGFNYINHHDKLVAGGEALLPKIKAAGLPNMILLSGNRAGISDDEGLRNCVTGVKRLTPLAEQLGVTLCMELLNSKRDHHDYQCDHTAWGVELVKRVGSPRFKLLYDIYHMQIMEGDIVSTILENIQYIGHFHTGGVPGRHELDATQELNWRRVAQAIAQTGFSGYVSHEFIPRRNPMESLRAAVQIFTL